MFQPKAVEQIKTHILCSVAFFSKIVSFMRQCGKIRQSGAGIRQYGAYALHGGYLSLQTHTHTQYVMFIVFPLQQWLHERASLLHYT